MNHAVQSTPQLESFEETFSKLCVNSTSLKLDHSIRQEERSQRMSRSILSERIEESLPLRALLVQDAVSAVLAPNRVAALQGHLRRALATDVHDRGSVNGHGAESALIAAAHRGHLVGFARHGLWCERVRFRRRAEYLPAATRFCRE